MKKQWISCGIAALFMVGCHCCAETVEGIVTASWLNARVFPELKSPRAVKLPRGQKIAIFKRHGAWLEIAAPATTPVYAAAAYLSGNKVLRDLNLRTEPASSAPVIARVKKGELLKAVSEPNRYGWVQVAPSDDMRLYVIHDYVQYDSSKVPVAGKTAPVPPAPVTKEAPAPKAETPAPSPKAEAPAPKAVVTPTPEKKEAPKFELTEQRKRELLNIGADIAAPVPYAQVGTLVVVPAPGGDCTRFALTDNNDGRNLGFVFAEAPIKLQTMLNKSVAIKGYAYRIAKWKNPVVAVTEITRAGE